jgi:transcriptional regulator with XRE-family HTH domain
MPARISRPDLLDVRLAIAGAIKERREALQMTQTELARRCRVPQPEISRIESGRFNPTIETVSAIAHELGMELTLRPRRRSDSSDDSQRA